MFFLDPLQATSCSLAEQVFRKSPRESRTNRRFAENAFPRERDFLRNFVVQAT